MSKIIINEIDNTTRTLGEYQNFSVVVPGFLGKGEASADEIAAAFDDNGIIELNKLSDFKSYIGKVKSVPAIKDPISPKLSDIVVTPGETPVTSNYTTVTADQFYSEEYKNHLYTATVQGEGHTDIGYLKGRFTLDSSTETPVAKYYTFELATEYGDGQTPYVYIESNNKGEDASEYTSQGNQIAYNLLKLGYTVLYKKLDNTTVYQDNPDDPELTGIDAMRTASFWEALKDKSNYDFRYITTGGYTHRQAYEQIGNIATFIRGSEVLEPTSPEGGKISDAPGRGDCIALIDFPENNPTYCLQNPEIKGSQSKLIKTIRQLGNALFAEDTYFNEYSRFFVPNVIYNFGVDSVYNPDTDFVTLPGSFHFLACAAKAARNFREWFAVAGYDRGTCDFNVVGTTLTLGDLATTALQPRRGYTSLTEVVFNKAINIITKIRGNYYLWGNRTAHTLKESGLIASDFANIRELCSSLKKVIWVACRQLTFSPNSDLLWVNFCNKVRPLLDTMKANEGIKDYAFVKVPTDKKAVMLGKIRIVPIEAVEDFELDLYLENSIDGQVVEVSED